jgi:hypothetical protein
MTSKAKNYTGVPHHQAWAQAYGIFLNPVDRERQIAGFEQMITTLHGLHKRVLSQKAPEPKISCRFEQHGFDIILQVAIRYPWESDLRGNYLGFQDDKIKRMVAIKIRGTIDDNYPATIRWISENRNHGSSPIADHIVLLVGGYNAARARLVEKMAQAEIKVVFAADFEAAIV